MTSDDILARVAAHYAHDAGVLLLSDLGEDLRAAGLWPVEGEPRQLYDIIDGMDGVTLVRDPSHKAYIVVVPSGREALAEEAIRRRADLQLLKRLPRAVLVAFCLDIEGPVQVYLRVEPPFRYAVGETTPGEPYLPIEEEFRIPALLVEDVRGLAPAHVQELAAKVRSWSAHHEIPIERLTRFAPKSAVTEQASKVTEAVKARNALERLHSAQSSDVAARMIVPIDIALALSKMP